MQTQRSRLGSKAVLAGIAMGMALLGATTPSRAQYYGDKPWCAVVNETDGEVIWLCQYRSFEECQPSLIGGNRGFCNVNPYYKPSAPAAHKSRSGQGVAQ